MSGTNNRFDVCQMHPEFLKAVGRITAQTREAFEEEGLSQAEAVTLLCNWLGEHLAYLGGATSPEEALGAAYGEIAARYRRVLHQWSQGEFQDGIHIN